MGDPSNKSVEENCGDNGEHEGDCAAEGKVEARVAWVKLGKIWWPGKVLNEDEMTEEMKKEVDKLKSKKSRGVQKDVHVVKYFNEDDFALVRDNPHEIIWNPDEEKKLDLVKRAILQMKSSSLADNLPKFKADVLQSEQLLDPSADLTTITRLLNGESLEEKKPSGVSKYADIFPSLKPEKPTANTSLLGGTPTKGGKSVKFNFPSSRIISTASSKPPSKLSPLPSDPSKKYRCNFCGYSADRVNVITNHMKYCKERPASSAATKSPAIPITPSPTSSSTSPQKHKDVTDLVASPVARKPDSPDITSPSSTPTGKRPGRPPRGSKAASTPIPSSSLVKSTPAKTTPSPLKTSVGVPKKRGRRSTKKDKIQSDKQKAEILNDWNDSTSDGENDTDDELDLPPSKPPELFLFGSEKNKKRKADSSPISVGLEEDGSKPGDDVGKTARSTAGTSGAEGGKPDEDQPPVLKKPRTDKELSEAFEALLKTTKPEYEKLLEKDLPGKGDEEEMEVEEDSHHMSDIEEDAHIVMKKVDIEDKEETEKEKSPAIAEEEKMAVEEEKSTAEVETSVEQVTEKKEEPKRETRRTTRKSRAAAQAAEVEEAKAASETAIETPSKIENDEAAVLASDVNEKKPDEDEKKKEEKSETGEPVSEEVSKMETKETPTVGLSKGRGRRRRASKMEESAPNNVKEDLKDVVEPVPSPDAASSVVDTTPTPRGRRGRSSKTQQVEIKNQAEVIQAEPPKTDETKKNVESVKVAVTPVAATLASTRSRRGAKATPVVVEDVKETPKKSDVKETGKKSEVNETPKKPEIKETSKKSMVKENSKKLEIKESQKKAESKETSKKAEDKETSKKVEDKAAPKKVEDKETPKKPEDKEAPKKPEVKEAPKKPEVEETSKKPEVKEAPKKPEVKETSKKPEASKDTPKKPEVKETPRVIELEMKESEVKVVSKKTEVTESSEKIENEVSKKTEVNEVNKKEEIKESKKSEKRESSKKDEVKETSKKPDETSNKTESKEREPLKKLEVKGTPKTTEKETVKKEALKEASKTSEENVPVSQSEETLNKVETKPPQDGIVEQVPTEVLKPSDTELSVEQSKTKPSTEIVSATAVVDEVKKPEPAVVIPSQTSTPSAKTETLSVASQPVEAEKVEQISSTVQVSTTNEVSPVAPTASPSAAKSKTSPKKQNCAPSTTSAIHTSSLPETAVVAPSSSAKVTTVSESSTPIAPQTTAVPQVTKATSPVKAVTIDKPVVQKPPPPVLSSPKSPSKRKAPTGGSSKPVADKATFPPLPVPVLSSQQKQQKQSAVVSTVTAVAQPPPPPIVTASSVPPPPPVKTPTGLQKKPTAAVRPLVDTKESVKEIPSQTPVSVKDGKGNATNTARISVPPPTTKSTANNVPSPSKEVSSQSQQPVSVAQPQPSPQSQQQQQQGIPSDAGDGSPDGKKSPALVAQRVVHLVPVENADGSITYMLLSLENGADNPAVLLEQGADAGSVLRLDKVEPMDTSSGGTTGAQGANTPLNSTEVEGIFLDKSVDNANQIVSALAAAATTGGVTASSSLMDATTAYVTLAMDASAMSGLTASAGIVDANTVTAATIAHQQAQSIITIPADAAATAVADSQEQQEAIVDASAAMGGQQVFYMTEDGALLDPQSLGLTLEQLQQLLNQ